MHLPLDPGLLWLSLEGGHVIRDKYEQFFRAGELLEAIDWYIDAVGSGPLRMRLERILGAFRERLPNDSVDLKRVTDTSLADVMAGRMPAPDLARLLRVYTSSLVRIIEAAASSPEKAKACLLGLIDSGVTTVDQILDAMCLLRNDVSDQRVQEEIRRWKQEYRQHKKDAAAGRAANLDSEIFWVSLDFHDSEDSVSRYRFRENLGIAEFETTFAEVERLLSASLIDGLDEFEMTYSDQHRVGSVYVQMVFNLWLVGRSRILTSRMRSYVDIALARIASWQSLDGWWAHPSAGSERPLSSPSTFMTALCSLVLVRLASSPRLRDSGERGLHWLLLQQEPSGCWDETWHRSSEVVPRPDLMATLWTLEGLSRSGIPNVERVIRLGTTWLLSQQSGFGDWNAEGWGYVFVTTLVLEYLDLQSTSQHRASQYVSLARGLLDRSVQLSYDEAVESARLSLISAYHGLESFLYAILSLPNVNKPIFRQGKKSETIGFRTALDTFQGYLITTGSLGLGCQIRFRNDLDRLAHLRDEVVHKALDVTAKDARTLTDAAFRFATYYCSHLGYDPWA